MPVYQAVGIIISAAEGMMQAALRSTTASKPAMPVRPPAPKPKRASRTIFQPLLRPTISRVSQSLNASFSNGTALETIAGLGSSRVISMHEGIENRERIPMVFGADIMGTQTAMK